MQLHPPDAQPGSEKGRALALFWEGAAAVGTEFLQPLH